MLCCGGQAGSSPTAWVLPLALWHLRRCRRRRRRGPPPPPPPHPPHTHHTHTPPTPPCLYRLRDERRPRDGDGEAAGKRAAHVRQRRRAPQQRRQVEFQVVQGEDVAPAEGDLQVCGRRQQGGVKERQVRRMGAGGMEWQEGCIRLLCISACCTEYMTPHS